MGAGVNGSADQTPEQHSPTNLQPTLPDRTPKKTNPHTAQDKLPTCPHVDDNSYRVSASGFRLVHGDVCTGIDKIISDTDGKGGAGKGGGGAPSRRRGKGGGGSGLLTLFMVLAALSAVGGAWFAFLATPSQKSAAAEVGGAAGAFCSGLWALGADWFDTTLARLGAGAGGLRFGGGGGGGGGGAYEPLDEELNYFQPIPGGQAEEARALVPPPLQRAGSGGGEGEGDVYRL